LKLSLCLARSTGDALHVVLATLHQGKKICREIMYTVKCYQKMRNHEDLLEEENDATG
jgi:hypothetical protein